MKTIFPLLRPRLLSAFNNLRPENRRSFRSRLIVFSLIGLLFWTGAFLICYRVLVYFQSVQDFGNILAMKLLSMAMMTFFALLIFSNIINSLSHLYLSRDLQLLHSLPVSARDIFFSRGLISAFDSSWMVVLFSLPVFLSYGIIYKAGIFFYLTVLPAIIFMCLITSALSSILVLFGAKILPAGRIRTILIILGVLLVLILILVLRLTRPEQLVNPENFASAVLYLNSLQTPDSPLLPTTWIADAVKAALNKEFKSSLFDLTLTGSCAFMLIFFAGLIAQKVYFKGFSKSQTTPGRLFGPVKYKGLSWENLFNFLPRQAKAFAVKEIRTFFRDSTQWPQLFLMGALIAIYLYNFSVLPLDKSPIKTIYLQNLFSFLNMGLAAFVLSAIAARFVFPAVSMEGAAFWIVLAAPVSLKTFLWIKFFVYYFPLLLMAEFLIVASNLLLQVSSFMMVLSSLTIFCLVPAMVAMGIGLGAVYPDFQSENPAQSVTSFGGLLYMILCFALIALVIILEAGPVYHIFMAGLRRQSLTLWQVVWLIGSFTIALFLCIFAIVYPMRLGARSLQDKQTV
jgi:ABC-2 type transport system permease protein